MKVTKEELIEISISLFNEHGYKNTTVKDICKECGVTQGAFYHYFKNKQDVLMGALNYDYIWKDGIEIVNLLLGDESEIEKLWKILLTGIDNASSLTPDTYKHAMIADLDMRLNDLNSDEIFESNINKDILSIESKLIREGQNKHIIRSDIEAELLLRAFYNGITGIRHSWCAANGTFDIRERAREYFEIIFTPVLLNEK